MVWKTSWPAIPQFNHTAQSVNASKVSRQNMFFTVWRR